MGNPLAVQLYTVRDELADDRARVLRRIAGFGYGAVEPFDVISDPDGLRADLDAAGLAVCSVHARPFGEQADAAFRGARVVGADTVIVPHMPPERFATPIAPGRWRGNSTRSPCARPPAACASATTTTTSSCRR